MFKHLKYILFYPKIGPDMYLTHWLLFFRPLRLWYQKRHLGFIGENAEVRPYATIIGPKNVHLGKNVVVFPFTIIGTLPDNPDSQIIFEDNVMIGPRSSIYSATHNFENPDLPILEQGYNVGKILIKKNTWIGANVVITPGVTIGEHCVIGANAVVTKDIPDFAIAGGIPAKVIRFLK